MFVKIADTRRSRGGRMRRICATLAALVLWQSMAAAAPATRAPGVEPAPGDVSAPGVASAAAVRAPYVFAEYYAIDPACASFAIGDVDGDGHDDIALAEPSGIGLLMNDDNDRFDRGGVLSAAGGARAVVSADFNRDGVDD